ncbi:MAG: NPCBM/NEW2 domain-containing protein [Bacteroidota bacterium]
MRRGKILALVAGIVIGLTLSLGGLVFASTALQVEMTPLKFFVDGADRTPPGGMYHNGSKDVPAGFVYEGTTYVPLKFVSELVGKDVSFREQDNSVWIGSKWPGKFMWYTDLKPSDFSSPWEAEYCTRDNWNNLEDAWNIVWDHGYALKCERWSYAKETIQLDGRFKQFSATLTLDARAKNRVADDRAPFLTIFVDDVQRYKSPTMTPTSRPVQISVDLTGAKTMRFEWVYGTDFHTTNTPMGLVDMKFFYTE